jgi:peptide/nickel transport system substrate-binding protein
MRKRLRVCVWVGAAMRKSDAEQMPHMSTRRMPSSGRLAIRRHAYACIALLLAVAVTACGGSKGQPAGDASTSGDTGSSKQYAELRWGMQDFPGGPVDLTRDYYVYPIELLAAQNLMEFEPDGHVKPALASSVAQPNLTTYVYHLKSVKFSDGKPMTSADVVYSLNRNITGKEAWDKSYFEDVASITARNSSTVVVKLKRPLATFQKILAFTGVVIEKATAEKSGEKEIGTAGHMPIGTGPWKIDSYTPEGNVRLSRNPYWTGPQQPASNIKIELFKTEASMALALRSGAIDGASTYYSPKLFASIPGAQQLKAPGEQVTFISVNTKHPPFNDTHVRRALAYATNSKGMIDALYPDGEATEAPLLIPNSLFTTLGSQSEVETTLAPLPKFEFNLEKAKQELAKSSYPHGFTMQIEVAQGFEAQIAAAQILTSDFAKIGVKAAVHEVTRSEEGSVYTGKATFWITDSTAGYPDPESIIAERLSANQIYPEGAGLNVPNYRNAEFDKLLSESAETLDGPKRLKMLGNMLEILRSDVPNWSMYSPESFTAISSKYVMPGFSFWTISYTPWALRVKLAS